ncbi:trypsin-like serine protease [Streptomyces anulatus]|uniref:trypsin-like serine protease n=1 Tax=Streptomyces TaxID=1883 RepID=UPI001B380567|nr:MULTISPECIES: trypsin-like serine protease [unclassified Streptomyces]MBQ1105847.1 trypsin-like serine protease [Streptomyces sp. 404i]MBQ1112394.1 trypsin-like serine protease [Streptomyces sp. C3-3]
MIRNASRGVRGAALVLAAATVGALTSVSPARAVIGDAVPEGTYAFTAQLTIGAGEQSRACTATLLNNNWLITAASCFADDLTQPTAIPAGPPKLKTTAVIGRSDLTGTGGQVRDVVDLVPHPERDLVVGKLATPVQSIGWLHPATTAPVEGEPLLGAGYGRTKDVWVPDRLHKASFTTGQVRDGLVDIDGSPVCKGDGGGPVFRETEGRTELVAVTSRSWQGGCLDTDETRTGAVAVRVDDIRTWIRDATASTLTHWKTQTLAKTSTGLYHAMRDSNGDWTGFGDVQKVAGAIEDLTFAAHAGISAKNYVFAVGGDGHVYEANRRPTGGWAAFRDLTADLGAKPGMTQVAVTSTGRGLALIGLASGRVYHAIQNEDETWTKWGDVSAQLGVLGNATQLTVAQTSGGNTHVGVVADKKAYHAIRRSDGTWTPWGGVHNQPTGLTSINGMAFAGIGGDLHVALTSPTGGIKHAIRAASGTWSRFGSLNEELGTDPAVSLDAAAVDGEFQTAIVTADGVVKHTLRHANGTWDATERITGYPGTATLIALTGSTS